MSKSSYKGITVDITFQGNTTKFNDAVSQVDKSLKNIDSELNNVNKALKLDPANTTLVGQKFELLGDKIKETKNKLELMRSAQKEIESAYARGEIDKGAYRDFQRELSKTESQLKNLNNEVKQMGDTTSAELKKLNEALKLDPSNAILVGQKLELLGTKIKEAKDKLKLLKDTQEDIKAAYKRGDIDEGAYRDFQRELAKTQSELKNLNIEVDRTVSTISAELKKAVSSLKTEFDGMVGVIKKGELALAAFSAASAKVGADFESGMSQVAATLQIQSGTEDYKKLSAAAKEMGETTSYSASQAASALNSLAQAGYTADESIERLPKTLALAKAGGLDLANAAKIVTNSMASLSLSEAELDKLLDEMARTGQKSNTNIAELGEAIKTVGGTMNMAGQSIETMFTELGMLANAGITAAEAGTHLRNIMLSLSAPTKEAQAELDRLGIVIADKTTGQIRDLSDILIDLREATAGMGNSELVEIFSNMFNVRDLASINALLNGTNGAMQALRAELENSKGAAAQMADTMGDNLTGDVTILKSAIEGLQIAVSERLNPSFRKATQDGTDFISTLTDEVKSGDLGKTFEDLGESINRLLNTGLQNASEWLPKIIDFLIKIAEHFDLILELWISMQAYAKSKVIFTALGEIITSVITLTGAIKGAQTAQEVFNAVAAANPVATIATAAAAVIAALTFGIMKASEAIDVTNSALSKASREVQEYADSISVLNAEIAETDRAHEQNIEAIEKERRGLTALADSVAALAEQQELSDGEYEKLSGYIDKLNESVPGLNLAFDEQTGALNMTREAMEELVSSYEAYQELNARIDYGADLERQRVELSDNYDEAKKKYLEAKARKDELEHEVAVAEQTALKSEWNGEKSPFSQEDIDELKSKLQEAKNNVSELGKSYVALGENMRDVTDKLDKNKEALEELSEKSEAYTEAAEEQADADKAAADAAAKLAEQEEETAKRAEALKNAYANAKAATAAYRSELKELFTIMKEVSEGTAYSTSQILDLIEKYPELASAIRQTADGYIIEAEAIEELTKARANDMLASIQMEIAALEMQLGEAMRAGDTALMEELRKRYGQLQDMKSAYSAIVAEIEKGNIYPGRSGGSSASSGEEYSYSSDEYSSDDEYADFLKQRKAEAEAEMLELERLYKLEEITAEEYYNRLRDLNEEYYADIDEFREEYVKNEEKVYAGLKKAQEDELAYAKKLEDQLRAVKEAEDALKRAESQQVMVYSGTAGFHAEKNTAAIEKAQQTLDDKNLSLLELLLKNTRFDGESLAERLQEIGLAQIKELLPDLSGLTLPSFGGGSITNNTTENRSVTYNGGDIHINIQGSVDETTLPKIAENIRETVRREIDAVFDEADDVRKIGGV